MKVYKHGTGGEIITKRIHVLYHVGLFLGVKFKIHYNKFYFGMRLPFLNITFLRDYD